MKFKNCLAAVLLPMLASATTILLLSPAGATVVFDYGTTTEAAPPARAQPVKPSEKKPQGSTNVEGPSKIETLKAIEELYDSQAPCTSKQSMEGDPNERSITYGDFNFSYDQDTVEFYSTFDIYSHFGSYSNTNKTRWVGKLNPGDIARIMVRNGNANDSHNELLMECSGNSLCIYDGSNRRKVTGYAIRFCDSLKRDRIGRALLHLRQFYTGTKPLPF